MPANRLLLADGVEDSAEAALAYLESVVGDEGPATSRARKEAFVHAAPEMAELLEREGFEFRRTLGYPDYYPDRPGASVAGRSIEGVVFDRTRLGAWNDRLPRHRGRRALPLGSLDAADFVRADPHVRGARTFARIVGLQALGRVRGQQLAAGGGSLIGQLLLAATRRGIRLWTVTPLVGLVLADGRVSGVVVEREGGRSESRRRAASCSQRAASHGTRSCGSATSRTRSRRRGRPRARATPATRSSSAHGSARRRR